jgi:8-hydroxy-5-deazaflavin:NADPH oxidoreductase
MKIAILGSGAVGQTLGAGFAAAGHDVKLGTRDPKKMQEWLAKAGKKASVGSFAEAAAFGEVAVLATSWDGTESAIKLADPKNLAGKVVMDVTNPLDFSGGPPPPRLAVGHTDSGGEQVQRWLPQSRVVKAFNIVGNSAMVQPQFPGGPPDMFIAGNDAKAKDTVAGFCKTFGWPPAIDLGGVEMSRYLEALAMVWIVYGFRTNTWNHAFKLLRK